MNEKLRFSYGHIIAIISLLFITYISFLGFYYLNGDHLTNGNRIIAIAATIAISLILFLLYSRVQVLKGADPAFFKYDKNVQKVILLILFCITAAGSFIPFSHFWRAQRNEAEIVDSFRKSLDEAASLFDSYEAYASERIEAYRADLERVENSRSINPDRAVDYKLDIYKASEMVEQLQLQLLPEISYYENFKKPRIEWIRRADRGASIWNPFLLSNIKVIESSANDWIAQLTALSSKDLANEHTQYAAPFAGHLSFDELNDYYTSLKMPVLLGILIGAACYLLLMMPFFLQKKHTKIIVSESMEKIKENDDIIYM